MSKLKLGQSLMRTIDGGKSKDGSITDNRVDDSFEQAKIENIDEIISSGEPIDSQIRVKPERMRLPKQIINGSFISIITLLLSFFAVCITSYSILKQKSDQIAAQKNMESLDTAIGGMNLKTDTLASDLAVTQMDVTINSNRLGVVDDLRKDILNIQEKIGDIRGELEKIRGDIGNQGTTIEIHQKAIEGFGKQIENLNARAASVPKKVVQRMPVKKANTDFSLIEGADVASIDLWGTQPYLMLREENGSWVPLTMGDHYKGWRLEGAIGSEVVFQQGSKTKRLTIKE